MALAGYRRLLKSAMAVFRGDAFALGQAKAQLKLEFRKNQSVRDAGELQQLLQGIMEVDEMLRFNIVQGARNNRGNYAVRLHEPEHLVTIQAEQGRPHGVDIAHIDKSILGDPNDVTVTKSTGSKAPKGVTA